ncbi:MAG: thioredoxin domain-containing protein [Chloroflexi bacterium]|nr:thioredoxin domain-containing protein [Chloroflexota bacterium]
MAKKAQMPKGGVRRKVQPAAKRASDTRWVLWAVIGAVVLVMVGVILLQSQTLRKPVETTNRTGEGTSWGPAGAKVKIIEYSDFGCTYCRQFALNQGKQLRADYEAGGRVRFEFKSLIVEGPITAGAANAAECAADQGRFWDYHDLLFNQQGVGAVASVFSKASLKQYGGQLGLATDQFNRCVDSDQHLDKVYRDASDGKGQGVQATPTFFINGQKIEGAAAYAEFKAKIEAALATGS